jgi:2-oxoisovalerate dehydrogenase E2 component (dihydrolipoyl transacylase)
MTVTATEGTQTFVLPDLGEGLTEGTVVRWMVAEGDEIAIDQAMVEIETAKSVVEVPSPFAGVVATLHAPEGDTLPVGEPLVTVSTVSDADVAAVKAPPAAQREADAYREEEQAGSGNVLIGYGTSAASSSGRRRRPKAVSPSDPVVDGARRAVPVVISPLVRALARDHGVDLRTLSGSGPGGLVRRADVEAAIQSPVEPRVESPAESRDESTPARAAGETRIPLSGFRKAVSHVLSRSRSEIPEATVWVDVDATALWELRESSRTSADPGPGLLAYIARFTVAALREYPVLNARIDVERQEIVQLEQINLGLAVQSERGLVVPAVMGAERLTTREIDREIRAVTAKAREGGSTPEELASGTFTLNNYGSFRVDGSAATINHPQVAILGFGRMIEKPWVVGGAVVPRRMTQMSFVFDHRVCDGGTAAGFMRSVADAVEDPLAAIASL